MILATIDRIRLFVFRLFNVMDSYFKKNTSVRREGIPFEMGDQSGTLTYRDKMERIIDEYNF